MPADAGTYNFTVSVTDQYGDTATSGSLSIKITAPTLTLPSSLAGGNVGTAYSASVAATGALGTTTYSLASGALPASGHLALNTSTGAIMGTPYAADAGVSTFSIKVTDQYGDTATSGSLSITIAAPTLTFPSSMAGGNVGTAYSASAAATGTVGTTTYTLNSGALPTSGHLALSSITGAITGTPYAADAGTYTFTVTVTDQYGDTATSGSLSITIAAPTITFPSSLAGGNVGTAYSASAAATGTVGTTTYTLNSGALPTSGHLALSSTSGAITGTPYAADAGVSTFTIKVTDQYGDTATSGSLSITIAAPTITFPSSLAGGTVGTAYSASAAATGAVGTTTYTLNSGALPVSGDLTLNAGTGAIAGTPYAADAGVSTFTIKVTDQYGDTATSGSLSITITAPTITFPSSLAGGTVGTAYSASAAATGTVGTTTYALNSGALPASGDLTLNAGTGAITGTPHAADVGTYPLTIKVTDQYGDTATSGTLNLSINAVGAITLGAAPTGTATDGVAYSSSLTATGGAGALTFSITVGSLPTGLTLNSTTGAITGTPTGTAQAYNFTAQAADGFGDTPASQAYTITLNPGAATHFVVAVTSATTITAGGAVNFTVTAFDASGNTATGYAGTVAFTSTDAQAALPANSALTSGTGSFAATLKTAGSRTITATDTGNATITGTSGNVTVNPGTATKFLVSAPSTATVGTQFNLTVTAQDGYNNTATGYAGTIHFTSSDGTAALPGNSGLTNGTGSFQATLNTVGTQTLTATDTISAATGTSGNITVSNALAISPSVLPSADLGSPYSFTLTAGGGSGSGYSFTTTGTSTLSDFGLSLATTGLISGTPTGATGTATFTAKLTDSESNTTTLALSIPVYGSLSLPSPNPSSLPSTGLTNQTYTGSITATGGTGTYSWTVTGLAGTGLTATPSANTLNIGGAPLASGAITFSVKLTDTAANNVSITQNNYTITVSDPIAVSLPTPSDTVPGSAVVGQSYGGSITASNGVGTYTWTVNGQPTTGSGYSLGDNITATSTGGSTLSFSGQPTSATTIGPFTVSVTDSTLPTNTSASKSYSIVVDPAGGQISGQINLNNVCGNVTLPSFTVTLTNTSTNATIPGTTNGSGQFSFSSVPPGTYSITPTIPGAAASVFSPANYPSVAITNGSNVSGENFSAAVGYTVSGTVSYGGSQTGQTYLYLQNNNCGGSNGNPGTSISESTLTSSGAYSISGVPPGNYTLYAWMDSTGIASGAGYPGPQGAPNTNNPTGSNTNVSVTNATVTTADVTLANPTYATPPSNPSFQVIPTNGGWMLMYTPPTVNTSNGSQQEAANEYVVQWAIPTGTDSASNPTCALGGGTGGAQFGTVAGGVVFYATGNGSTAWILNNTSMGAGTFNGGAYCFQARAFNTLATNQHPSGWSDYTDPASSSDPLAVAPVTSNTFCTTNCTAVSGTITIPAGVHIATGAPLYVGYLQETGNNRNPSAIYATEIATPVTGANSFSITIPNGSGYALFAIYDENNDGAIDAYDVTNIRDSGVFLNPVTFSGTPVTDASLTLPAANSTVQVQTRYFTSSNGSSYSLNFKVGEQNKLPVSVTLSNTSVGTPYLMMPVDISLCTNCGNNQYGYYVNLPGGTPSVGDSFDFTVTYSDGSQDNGTTVNGAVTAFGSTGALVDASDAPTSLQATAGTTPDFSWTDSANATGNGFYYSFYLNQQSGTCPGNNCTIWEIPGQNSKSNGFSSSITSLTWGSDPTGGGSTPNGSLSSANNYSWSISVQDSNGNQAQSPTDDNNP